MRLLVFTIVLGLSTAALGEKRYSLADLGALEKQAAFGELLDHAEDVAPTERDERWQRLVVSAARKTLERSATDDPPGRALEQVQTLFRRFAFLKNAPDLMKARGEIGLRGYEACFQRDRDEPCLDQLNAFVAADPDRKLAERAARLVMRHRFHYFAVPLFRRAVEGGARPDLCEDADLYHAVFAALKLPRDHKLVPDAQEILGGPCWGKLEEYVIDELSNAAKDSYIAANTCAVAAKKGALRKVKPNPCPK